MDIDIFLERLSEILNLKVSRPVQRLLRVMVKSPLYISPSLRTKYLESLKDVSTIDLLSNAKQQDMEFLIDARNQWLQKSDLSNMDPKVLIEDLNSFSTYRMLLESLENESDCSEDSNAEINEHWFDLADQFYKMRNEPWRKELIGNAILDESKNPGKVSNKTVWNIAMMEEADFLDLYDFLKNSVQLYVDGGFFGYVLFGYYGEISARNYTTSQGNKDRFENLIERLEAESNLTLGNGSLTIAEDSVIEIISKSKKVKISGNGLTDKNPDIKFLIERGVDVSEEKKKSQIYALPLNPRGHQISKYCKWEMTDDAEELFLAALEQQKKDNNLTVEIEKL